MKWQEALGHWDEWNKSITQSRERIQDKYGALDELLANAKFSVDLGGEANKPTIRVDMNQKVVSGIVSLSSFIGGPEGTRTIPNHTVRQKV